MGSARLADLAKSFARHLQAEGKSARTVTIYGQSVRFFSDWLVAQGREPVLAELTRAAVREWLAQLGEVNLESTVKTRHRGLFRFSRWLVDEGEIAANPMVGLSPPEPAITPVPILSDDELARLVKVCTGTSFVDRRDEAMIRLMFDAGVRVSEASGLDLEDLDLDQRWAMVKGKGRRTRPVYFGLKTTRALDRYLRIRSGHRLADSSAVFLSQRGRMTPDGIRERMKVRGRQAGVSVHPHQFRHTFAHDFLVNGGQERDLKRLAGWSSDVMLERYGASAADMRARTAAERMRRGDRI